MRASAGLFLVIALPLASMGATAASGGGLPPALELDRETLEAPSWELGDWWSASVTDPRGGPSRNTVLVVADLDSTTYFVGVAAGEPYLDLLTFHVPFIGPTTRADLSYRVHNEPFEPLQFPLEEGRRWTTQFDGHALTAAVTAIDGSKATIDYRTGSALVGQTTYDAGAETLTEFWMQEGSRISIHSFGHGYACSASFPARHELLFLETWPTPIVESTGAEPKTLKTMQVSQSYDRAILALAVWGGAGSLASIHVVPPDGTVHDVQALPSDPDGYSLELHEAQVAAGTWHLNGVADSGGWALAAAIGFDPRTRNLGSVVPPEERGFAPACPNDAAALEKDAPTFGARAETPPVGPLALAGLALASALGAAAALHRRWPSFLALGLYAKIPHDRVLDHPVRRDICQLLTSQPGLTTQEIRRSMEIGWGNTVHHLAILERAGLVVGVQWGHNRNWFLPAQTPPASRSAISALRRGAARTIYEQIAQRPGISQEELAEQTRRHHSTIIFHVNRLMEAALITKERDGLRVRYYPTESGAGVRLL